MPSDLSRYKRTYSHRAGVLRRSLWYLVNHIFLRSGLFPFNEFKCFLLRMFGAKVGKGVIIKPRVNIKYAWMLEVGDHSWIGEEVWIDNLDRVKIGAHCCLSQRTFVITGNHNYKKETFDLETAPVILEDGVWIGAGAILTPGVRCGSHAVLSAGSVATKDLAPSQIYQGNPAQPIRAREILS